MTSRDEEIAAEVRQAHVLYPKAVDTVHTQQHPIGLASGRIDRRQRLGHAADGQLDAGAGVHPGHRDHSCLRLHGLDHRVDNFFLRRSRWLLVQRDLVELGARARGAQLK
jgi:hypothetical protein